MRMPKTVLTVLSAAICLMLNAAPALAADQLQLKQELQLKTQPREPVYGNQLMTRSEIAKYRARMRGLKTTERRLEHRRSMQQRAREMSNTPPAVPPAQGASTPCGKNSGDETGLCGHGWSKYALQSGNAPAPEADRLPHPLMALLVMLAIQKTGMSPAAFVERN